MIVNMYWKEDVGIEYKSWVQTLYLYKFEPTDTNLQKES